MQHLTAKLEGRQFVRLSSSQNLFGSNVALPILIIDAPFCQATIALQGAQLLTFQPTGDAPWLWLSPKAVFAEGKSVRGGIPVCLPWFGVNRQNPQKPKHGFARNHEWTLTAIDESADAVNLQFRFDYAGDQPELFATPFAATLSMELSNTLHITLDLHNTGKLAAEFSWALHTYFAVADCQTTRVTGLENRIYLDNTQHLKPVEQQGAVEFLGEVDRVYANTTTPQTITAPMLHTAGHKAQHSLLINGEHCPTCIVWNAGESVAASLADIGDNFRQYICVERGCAFDDALQLAAGEQFSSTMRIVRSDAGESTCALIGLSLESLNL